MPSIRSLEFSEGVTETVVPGQTSTSPPLAKRRIVVLEPAMSDDPAARLLEITTLPTPSEAGTTTGPFGEPKASAAGGCDFLSAEFASSGALNRIISRFPASSHE